MNAKSPRVPLRSPSAHTSFQLGRAPAPREREAALAFLSEVEALRKEARLEAQALAATAASEHAGMEALLEAGRARVRSERDAAGMITGESAAESAAPPALPTPLAAWEFDEDLRDALGPHHGELHGPGRVQDGLLALEGGWVLTEPLARDLGARTLEVRVRLDGLEQRGSGALAIQTLEGGVFDAIVFNERRPGEWLAGSDFFNRTEDLGGAPEREQGFVVMAVTYAADGTITAYRDGVPYGSPIRKAALVRYEAGRAQFLLAGRHGSP